MFGTRVLPCWVTLDDSVHDASARMSTSPA
jgi:hypothetical protein